MSSVPHRLQFVLTCLAIVSNSLSAGGVFMMPILAPTFTSVMKLTQSQLTVVSVAGLIGQYPFSPLVGMLLDLYGPQACSAIAGVLFFTCFSGTAIELSVAANGPEVGEASPGAFWRLASYFFVTGLATVFSYFSSIFAAAKMVPGRPGLSSGSSMAAFGLSPLFLSTLSTLFTESPSGSLWTIHFLSFLALLTLTTHVFGAIVYRGLAVGQTMSSVEEEQVNSPSENTSLLPQKLSHDVRQALSDPLKDWCFFLLALYCLVTLGACEMIISNLGTIVMSLPVRAFPGNPPSGTMIISTSPASQVKIVSIFNTASRLLIGPLADYLSPFDSRPAGSERSHSKRLRITRVAFLTGAALSLAIAFLWMEMGVQTREKLWVLSVCVGISYGTVFTVLPGILSAIWGAADLGRNFGIITYAPFIGTPVFSSLYAYVSASVANKQGVNICQGKPCWQITFWICLGTSLFALLSTIVFWRKWRGKL